jgi:uncharacterized protein (TIGR02246 family)
MVKTTTIESLHEQWIAAFNAHDLDRHIELYTKDALLFGSVDDLKKGREAIRSYFAGRGPNVHVKSYPMPHITHVSEGVVITAGHVDFADGPSPMPYRLTWTLVRRADNWRIAQHHGSPRRELSK